MEPPIPKPRVSSTTILLGGLLTYVVAVTYPKVIILVTLILSRLIPYLFRVNDDGDSRRMLWTPWSVSEERPEEYQPENIAKNVNLKESYWKNDR